MRFRPIVLLPMLLAAMGANAQTPPSNPAAAPRPAPIHPHANPASAPTPAQPNPASAPVVPASDAGATERGMSTVEPTSGGVTPRVQNANAHDVDARGHTLDPHGRPVGQKPAVSSSVP